jgi:hypothetical protein
MQIEHPLLKIQSVWTAEKIKDIKTSGNKWSRILGTEYRYC